MLTKDVVTLQKNVAILEKRVNQKELVFTNLHDVIIKRNKAIETLEEMHADLSLQIQRKKKFIAVLTEQSLLLHQEKEKILRIRKKEVAILIKRMNATKKSRERMKEENHTLRRESSKLRTRFMHLKEKVPRIEARLLGLKANEQHLKQQLPLLEEERAKLHTELQSLKLITESIEKETSAARHRLFEITAKKDALVKEIHKETNVYNARVEQFRDVRKKVLLRKQNLENRELEQKQEASALDERDAIIAEREEGLELREGELVLRERRLKSKLKLIKIKK